MGTVTASTQNTMRPRTVWKTAGMRERRGSFRAGNAGASARFSMPVHPGCECPPSAGQVDSTRAQPLQHIDSHLVRQPYAVTAVPSAWTSQWTQGNSFRLLEDGREFFPRMLAAIEAARSFVLLEMYLVQSGVVTGRFIDAFVRARARGVEVYFLVDAFGALRFAWGDRERLVAAGVHLADYNTLGWRKRLANLLRDHRKLLVVDDEVAFVGGAGLTD